MEEDEVGEVDFQFDLSDWMVVDDDADNDDESEQIFEDLNTGGKSVPARSEDIVGMSSSVRAADTLLSVGDNKSLPKKPISSKTLPSKNVPKPATISKSSTPEAKEAKPAKKDSASQSKDAVGSKLLPSKIISISSETNTTSVSSQRSTTNKDQSSGSKESSEATVNKATEISRKITSSSSPSAASKNTVSAATSKPDSTVTSAGDTSKHMSESKVILPSSNPVRTSETTVNSDTAVEGSTSKISNTQATSTTEKVSPSSVISSSGSSIPVLKTDQSVKVSELSEKLVTAVSKKTKIQARQVADDSGSIADIMESVDDQDDDGTGSSYDYEIEDVSDTEFSDGTNITRNVREIAKREKAVTMKRQLSPGSDGLQIKKSKSSVSETNPAVNLAQKTVMDTKKTKENQGKKILKKPAACGTAKASFGAVKDKTQAVKIKTQTLSTTASLPNITTVKDQAVTQPVSKPADVDTTTTPSAPIKTPVKRIVHRFHRTTQTTPKNYTNKLLQCWIKVPTLDSPPKATSDVMVQTASDEAREVFFMRPLPDTVKTQVFKVVSTFDVNNPSSRNIISGTYDYGISLGHVTSADLEKSLFRENILTKSDYYNLCFHSQGLGVVDLYFADEEKFTTVITNIRKTRIGPRYLVVTFSKNVKVEECDSACLVSRVKATVIFDQNFATTAYLTHMKAPVWNKPKVEETLTIFNMPGGIPLEFLKLLIPDVITIEMDDENLKFTQEGSPVHLGLSKKNGCDRVLKLFTQMYMNNECLVFSKCQADVKDIPEMKDILANKRQKKKDKQQRVITARKRDISDGGTVAVQDGIEVIMQVDSVDDVEKVKPERKGPTSSEPEKQTGGPQSHSKLSGQPKGSLHTSGSDFSKNPALTDVSDELSDISDTSDFGEESRLDRKSESRKQTSIARKSSSRVRGGTRNSLWTDSPGKAHAGMDNEKRRKLRSATPSDSRRGRKRFDAENCNRTSSQHSLDRNSQGAHYSWQEKGDRNDWDQASRSRGVERRRELSSGHELPRGWQDTRQNHSDSRVLIESESTRDRLLRELSKHSRDRLQESGKNRYDHCDNEQHSSERADRQKLDSGSDYSRRRSAEPFSSQEFHERDRHGNIIERLHVRRHETGRLHPPPRTSYTSDDKISHVVKQRGESSDHLQDRLHESRSHAGSKYEKQETFSVERDNRRGNLPDRHARGDGARKRSKEVDIYERRIRGDNNPDRRSRGDSEHDRRISRQEASSRERDKRVVRAASPLTRHAYRGRSSSPGRQGRTSLATRRFSPSPTTGALGRITLLRRSISPRRPHQGSALSPISLGDENENLGSLHEGMWLSQPPAPASQGFEHRSHIQTVAGRTIREDMRKVNNTAGTSKNLVAVPTEWKASVENVVHGILSTNRAVTHSGISTGQDSTLTFKSDIRESSQFLERMKEFFDTGAGFTDSGNRIGLSGPPNATGTVASNLSGGDNYATQRVDQSRSGPMFAASQDPAGGRVPLDHGRDLYDRKRIAGSARFDAPVGGSNPHQMFEPQPLPIGQQASTSYLPPPVPPPLFTSTPHQDRISQMEALAKQLASDIQKQQNQPVQPSSHAPELWSFSTAVSVALSQLTRSMTGPPPVNPGPFGMAPQNTGPQNLFPGPSRPPRPPCPPPHPPHHPPRPPHPQIRPANPSVPQDPRAMNPHPQYWPPGNFF